MLIFYKKLIGFLMLFLLYMSSVLAEPGAIYTDVSEQPQGFLPHQMPFVLPQDEIARAEFKSEAFYAVILKSDKPCAIEEAERLAAQKLFADNKVFVNRFYCDDVGEDLITYTNVNEKYSFMAVYAGKNKATAKAFFNKLSIADKFPGANIRKMQVMLVYP